MATGEKIDKRDLVDDLDDAPMEAFQPGEHGRIMVPGLIDLVNHYMKDNPKREDVIGFLKWVPPTNLEEFLVMCMEYGSDRTKPGNNPKNTRRKAAIPTRSGA